ncbi:MAG: polyhydroxybutyrate depolymerase [Parvicella sp.]|jgi:polyhydroxybutyrate depolymerase
MKNLLSLVAISISTFTLAQTTTSKTITHNGGTREYNVYVPASYDGTVAVPIVLNLHGYGSNNTQQMQYADFKPIADTANFIIVLPQGLLDPVNSSPHWNANWGTGIDDIGFISAMLDTISSNYNINQDRMYSTGMSNGGFMSLTLAGQLSNKITAVASVTGTMSVMQIPNNTVVRPVPVMQIHGTNDPTVSYSGDANFLSVDSVVNFWAGHNQCSSTPVFTAMPDINTSDGCTAEKYEYLGGIGGSEVVHYKIIGGEHTWPGAFPIAVTNQDINACIEIWKFFNKYEMSNLLNQENIYSLGSDFKLTGANPTEGLIQISSESNSTFDFDIINISGQLMESQRNIDSSTQLDFTALSAGIYLVSIKSNGKSSTFKVVRK